MVAKHTTSENRAVKQRILLVDDHRAFREGLREFLNEAPDLSVCCEAEDVQQALSEVETTHPDMVITDISLKEQTTVRLIQEIKARHPLLPVLVFSMRNERVYAGSALHAGADGYLPKSEPPEKVLTEIHRVLFPLRT